MARLVCLYFDDNESAEEYVEHVQDMPQADVVAFFAVPTQLCECGVSVPQNEREVRQRRIVKGQKFGWWVHRDCGKPVYGSYQSPRNLTTPQGKFSKIYVSWTLRNDLFKGPIADR